MRKLILGILIYCLTNLFSHTYVLAAPRITIQSAPPQTYKNEEFSVTFDITSEALSSDSYYAKGRIGSTSATLNQGETFNPSSSSWFTDTSGWTNFPLITFSNSTIATGTVTLRTKSTATIGNNLLLIRINRNSASYDSFTNTLLVLDPPPTPTATLTPTPTPTPEPTANLPTQIPTGRDPDPTPAGVGTTPTPIFYQNIYISEAMVNPSSGENEWIELFNNNDFSVALTNWFIDDVENAGSSPKLFSLDIQAKNYGVVDLSSSMFNNTGDSVRILDFNKNLADSLEYTSSTQGKSYGRISYGSDEFCQQEPSKNQPNGPCINPTATPQPTQTKTPTTKIPAPAILSVTAVMNRLINITPSVSVNLPAGKAGRYIDTNIGEGEILGVSSRTKIKKYFQLIRFLSFISFSYSFLTIFSLFLRIKIRYGKSH